MPAVPVKKFCVLSKQFRPKFWKQFDQRDGVVQRIKDRYRRLVADSAADSFQKQLIAERAAFLSIRIETMEVESRESGDFSMATYTHALNSLVVLLKSLGLERRTKAQTLKAYLEAK